MLGQIPPERVEAAIVQIDLAKHFALMGLYSIATALSSTNISETNRLRDVDAQELNALKTSDDDLDKVFQIEYLLPHDSAQFAEVPVRRARFTMSCPLSLYNTLIEAEDLERALRAIVIRAKKSEWHEDHDDHGATLTTPLGFTLRLEYLSN